MPEASCAADIVASIISSENFIASRRGKKAIFLGYKEDGLGDTIIRRFYSKEIVKAIVEDKNIDIVSSPDEFFDKIKQFLDPAEIVEPPKETEKSVDKILNIVLENKEK